MNEQEKRIKLAEWGGWICCADYGDEKYFHQGDALRQVRWPDSTHHGKLPDYLNAVHELEKKLTVLKRQSYERQLMLDCLNDSYPLPSNCLATAAQRCEALGRTLNLWT